MKSKTKRLLAAGILWSPLAFALLLLTFNVVFRSMPLGIALGVLLISVAAVAVLLVCFWMAASLILSAERDENRESKEPEEQ